MTKGSSIEKCVEKANKYIEQNGICLLLFDVKGNRNFTDRQKLQNDLEKMMQDLNNKFEEYFPAHYLATSTRYEKGFQYLLLDGSWTGINSAEIIPEIIEYQKENYPNLPLYWDAAADGWDEEGVKIVK